MTVASPKPVQAPSCPWLRIGTRAFRYSASGRSVGTSIRLAWNMLSLKSSVSGLASSVRGPDDFVRCRAVLRARPVVVLWCRSGDGLRLVMASYYQRRASAGRGGRIITVQSITVLLNPHAGTQDADVAARVTDAFRRAGVGELDVRV